MPLSSSIVGKSVPPLSSEIDARWMMAYAAALGDALPCYFDTRRPEGIVAHPMFPVCFEWPASTALREVMRAGSLTAGELVRGVHATHDALIHRSVRPGDRLSTTPTIVMVERRKPGAYMVTRLDTVDASGKPVGSTWYGTILRGVEVTGDDRRVGEIPQRPRSLDGGSFTEVVVPVSAGAAHVYTECARIWNPIHTDAAVAAAAGLPDIILHGTATLALAVSQVVRQEAGDDPRRVARIAGRMGAMVMLPSELRVQIGPREANRVHFAVLNGRGEFAIRDGIVELRF